MFWTIFFGVISAIIVLVLLRKVIIYLDQKHTKNVMFGQSPIAIAARKLHEEKTKKEMGELERQVNESVRLNHLRHGMPSESIDIGGTKVFEFTVWPQVEASKFRTHIFCKFPAKNIEGEEINSTQSKLIESFIATVEKEYGLVDTAFFIPAEDYKFQEIIKKLNGIFIEDVQIEGGRNEFFGIEMSDRNFKKYKIQWK